MGGPPIGNPVVGGEPMGTARMGDDPMGTAQMSDTPMTLRQLAALQSSVHDGSPPMSIEPMVAPPAGGLPHPM